MAHIFDTLAPKPARTLIQQGVVSLLSPLLRSNGGYLRTVAPFGAVVRSYTDDVGVSMLQDVLKVTPGIAVATGTRSFQSGGIGGRSALGPCELLLYFATSHARNQQLGRQESDAVALANDQADPGLHVIMEHAMELVLGQYPSNVTMTVKQIRIETEQELATLEHMTIWMQTYSVTTLSGSGSREFRNVPQLLESIGWRITTEADTEAFPPATPVSPTSIDADTDINP